MIGKGVKCYCKDDISLIENYEKAVNDNTQIWHCHHRLETDLNMSLQELIDNDLYLNRPASELIFLTKGEHTTIHKTNHIVSQKTRNKISKTLKQTYKEHPEILENITKKRKGRKAWNKGIMGVRKETSNKMSKNKKDRKHLSKPGCPSVFVKPEKVQYYLDLGYHFGRK